jgi:hypothetical protein
LSVADDEVTPGTTIGITRYNAPRELEIGENILVPRTTMGATTPTPAARALPVGNANEMTGRISTPQMAAISVGVMEALLARHQGKEITYKHSQGQQVITNCFNRTGTTAGHDGRILWPAGGNEDDNDVGVGVRVTVASAVTRPSEASSPNEDTSSEYDPGEGGICGHGGDGGAGSKPSARKQHARRRNTASTIGGGESDDGGGKPRSRDLGENSRTRKLRKRKKLRGTGEDVVQNKKNNRKNSRVSDPPTASDASRMPLVESDSYIFLLGVVYGASNCKNYKELLRLLKQGEIGPKPARDAARCLLTEELSGMTVISIDSNDRLSGFFPRWNHHSMGNLNFIGGNSTSVSPRFRQAGDRLAGAAGRIAEVYLDYCWSVGSYWQINLSSGFYKGCLPWLAGMLSEGGTIALPLHPHIFVRLVEHTPFLAPYLSMQLVTNKQSKDFSLVAATDKIDPCDWRDYFGKDTNQQTKQEMKNDQTMGSYLSETLGLELKRLCIEVYGEVRHDEGDVFILLTKLPKIEFGLKRRRFVCIKRL